MKNLLLFVLVASVGLLLSCGKDDIQLGPIELEFSETSASVGEDSDPITVTLSFPEAEREATVALAISGTAVYGDDYTTSPAVAADQILFEVDRDQTSISFTFTPINDDVYTDDLTVVASLEEAAGIVLGDNMTYTITIEDDGDLSDETIDLGEGEAFNVSNFLHSFEQLFTPQQRFAYTMDHMVEDGQVTMTEHYQGILGGFEFYGDYFIITHNYQDGVITSSDRTTFESLEAGIGATGCDNISFEYTFDSEGYISGMTKYKNGQVRDEVTFAYDENMQLLTKTHASSQLARTAVAARTLRNQQRISGGGQGGLETFTYNEDGTVATYQQEGNLTWTYTYTGGFMTYTEGTYGEGPVYTETYAYNGDGLVEEATFEDLEFGEVYGYSFEYGASEATVHEYVLNIPLGARGDLVTEGTLVYSSTFIQGGIQTGSMEYYYSCLECKGIPVGGVLDYAIGTVYDLNSPKVYDEGCDYFEGFQVGTKEFWTGAIGDLTLVGYAVIESRTNNKKAEESVYDGDDTLLYTLDFTANPGDYCSVVVTDEVNGGTVGLWDEGGFFANVDWYFELFPNNSFCQP